MGTAVRTRRLFPPSLGEQLWSPELFTPSSTMRAAPPRPTSAKICSHLLPLENLTPASPRPAAPRPTAFICPALSPIISPRRNLTARAPSQTAPHEPLFSADPHTVLGGQARSRSPHSARLWQLARRTGDGGKVCRRSPSLPQPQVLRRNTAPPTQVSGSSRRCGSRGGLRLNLMGGLRSRLNLGGRGRLLRLRLQTRLRLVSTGVPRSCETASS